MTGRWWALGAVSLATFMTNLDNNVVNVALPTIQRDLGLSISGLEWIVSAYILVYAGLLLAGGRLADVFGARAAFFAGLGLFTISSVAAGLAGGQEALITARAAQGMGAALLAPSSLALLPEIFPDPGERGTAVGVWSAVAGLALAVGPLTGGVIVEHAPWGWIFLINVPIGAATVLIGLRTITIATPPGTPHPAGHGSPRGLDLPGLVTSAFALFALTYALIEGESHGWTSALILGCLAVAVAAAVAFVAVESHTHQPMIDLALFRSRMFSGGVVAMGLLSFNVFGIYFLAALYLQGALGFGPTSAGAAFAPMALVMAGVSTVSPRIARRAGSARTVAAGLALLALATVGFSRIGEGDGYLDLLPWFLIYGAGGGLLVPLTNVVLDAMPPTRAGVPSGVLSVSREVFGLLGITVLGAILTAGEHTATGAALHRFIQASQSTLLVAAAITLAGVPVGLYALRPRAASATTASAEAGTTA